jgi:protoporphyrinogen oxidase
MRIGIIGAGILGISLGYYLSKNGHEVRIFEASDEIGGLAGSISLEDGTKVDRFYHAILSSDVHLRKLCHQLDVADHLRFSTTKTGFFHKGQLFSMNNIIEFLKFPPLGWIDRFRLGLTVLSAQFVRDWKSLEGISVEEWLLRRSGRVTYENIWKPMLRAKFDGTFKDTPATYIWARLVRMKSTRQGASQKEEAGHLVGGYETLLSAMARQIHQAGGLIEVNRPVLEVMIDGNNAWGLRFEREAITFDRVVSTLQLPITHKLIPDAQSSFRNSLLRMEYLGIIGVLLVLDRSLSDYWTINITDNRFPFTGLIETTAYIDPKYVGGHHLVYLPKYVSPKSPWVHKSDEEIRDLWIESLEDMFPSFDRSWIEEVVVHRERFVEPLHGLNQTDLIPEIETPIRNLLIATTAQIYPQLTNGESVTSHARLVAEKIGRSTQGEN